MAWAVYDHEWESRFVGLVKEQERQMVARLNKITLPPPLVRVMAGGHDVTDKMPLTRAELERQRPNQAFDQPHHGHPAESVVPAVGQPLPKSIGICADLYHDVRELRLSMEKEVEAVKARENEIREHIISNLSTSDDTGAAGKRYRAQIVVEVKPKVNDWNKVWDYVYHHNRFDLLQKRLGEKAVADLWADGVEITGIEKMNLKSVSITKI